MTADVSADLALMRASMVLDSDPASAIRQAGDILARWPDHEAATLLLSIACRRLGDPAVSLSTLEPLARSHPASPLMQLELGRMYAACGRTADALAAFEGAVACDVALADGWKELAAQRFMAGDVLGGDAAYAQYSRLAPEPHELVDAKIAVGEGRLDAAAAGVQRRLQSSPHDVAALRLLADVSARRGDHAEAAKTLNDCLTLAPGYAAARYDLARVLYAQQSIDEALPHIERLLATEPGHAGYLKLKAQVLRLVGRIAESVVLIEQVVAERPDDAEGWLLLGNLMRELGRQALAIDAYRRAITVRPGFDEAYWALANLKTFRFSTEDIVTLQRQVARSAALGSGRTRLEFTLGKAFEDAGDFAASFQHYAHGNALHRGTLNYDPAATTADVGRTKATYTAEFFTARVGWGNQRPDPIFIVGMPRSGSTLVEQILATHTQVEGTRELPDIPAIVADAVARVEGTGKDYPESATILGAAEIDAMAARYLRQTEAHRPLGRSRFVDKMLGNFSHLGLLHLMFPQAAIIDVRRHPLGCGFSCYKQLFAQGMHFSYHLGELGAFYYDYADLMLHLDGVLPAGRVHRLYYEQLVTNPEGEVRRLLDYCRLPFEAECLRFYNNPRVVQTLSSEQVRRPIYSEGVDQWRHYEPWLGPLREVLGNAVNGYPVQVKPG